MDGANAARSGLPASANPHIMRRDESVWWFEGWRSTAAGPATFSGRPRSNRNGSRRRSMTTTKDRVPISPDDPPVPVPPGPPPEPPPGPDRPPTPIDDPPGPEQPIPDAPDVPPAGDPPSDAPVRMSYGRRVWRRLAPARDSLHLKARGKKVIGGRSTWPQGHPSPPPSIISRPVLSRSRTPWPPAMRGHRPHRDHSCRDNGWRASITTRG
jgi:hypothetical protein